MVFDSIQGQLECFFDLAHRQKLNMQFMTYNQSGFVLIQRQVSLIIPYLHLRGAIANILSFLRQPIHHLRIALQLCVLLTMPVGNLVDLFLEDSHFIFAKVNVNSQTLNIDLSYFECFWMAIVLRDN